MITWRARACKLRVLHHPFPYGTKPRNSGTRRSPGEDGGSLRGPGNLLSTLPGRPSRVHAIEQDERLPETGATTGGDSFE
jgi:hypothetical protein